VVRAIACGADFVMAGRPFLYAIGALGEPGASYIVNLLLEQIRTTFAQIGARNLAEAQKAMVRHPNAYKFPPRKA
jgi:L-lactate dehydrogenase (cytochrome)